MHENEVRPAWSLTVAWATTAGLAVVAGAATFLANSVIVRNFPDAVRPDDLLFELLPYIGPARWLTLVALVVGIGTFIWVFAREAPSRLPTAGAMVAVMYLLRAGMIILTPLAPAYGDGYFVFPQEQFGMFPSGHTAMLTLLALMAHEAAPWARRTLWGTVAMVIIGLVLARGHYSIDIVGGLLLAYFVATVRRHGKLFSPITARTGQ